MRGNAASFFVRAAAPVLAAALCIAFLTPRMLFAAPLAAIAVSLWEGLRRMPFVRRGDAVFAPDPLAPDFRPLLKTVREMLEAAKAQGLRGRIVLTPMPSATGGFAEYSLRWDPKHSAMEASWPGGTTHLKSAVPVFLDAPMPVIVGRFPVAVSFAPDGRSGRVAVSAVGADAAGGGGRTPRPRTAAWLFYLSGILVAARLLAGEGDIDLARTAVFAAAPVVIRRLVDFSPRIIRAVKSEAAFAKNLLRRLAGSGPFKNPLR